MANCTLSVAMEALLVATDAARSAINDIRTPGHRGIPEVRAAALEAAKSLRTAAMVAGAQEHHARQNAGAAQKALYAGRVAPCLLPTFEPALESLLDACDALEVVMNEAFEVANAVREELELGNVLNWMDVPP
jgi:hypothetical protein